MFVVIKVVLVRAVQEEVEACVVNKQVVACVVNEEVVVRKLIPWSTKIRTSRINQ